MDSGRSSLPGRTSCCAATNSDPDCLDLPPDCLAQFTANVEIDGANALPPNGLVASPALIQLYLFTPTAKHFTQFLDPLAYPVSFAVGIRMKGILRQDPRVQRKNCHCRMCSPADRRSLRNSPNSRSKFTCCGCELEDGRSVFCGGQSRRHSLSDAGPRRPPISNVG